MTASTGEEAPARAALVALATRLYPFYSGAGRLANLPLIDRLAGRPRKLVWARVQGGRMLAPLDDHVGRAAFYVGDLDPKLSWVMRRAVSEGDVVLDIGANLGLVTLRLAARVGRQGRVHAFEPNPAMLRLLTQTIARSAADRVTLHPIGLGEADGALTLSALVGNAGSATFAVSPGAGYSVVAEAKVRRLDDFAAEIGLDRLDFIKIDVEGFEFSVLKGGASLIGRLRPKVIVFEERAPAGRSLLPPSLALLQSLDYGLYALPRRLVTVRLERVGDRDPGNVVHDYVAVSRDPSASAVRLRLGIDDG
jgi:FkbM family methyltransferase